MKIISKRGQIKKLVPPDVAYITDIEEHLIIVNGGEVYMSPDKLKAVEDMFEQIRKELEKLGAMNSSLETYDGGFW